MEGYTLKKRKGGGPTARPLCVSPLAHGINVVVIIDIYGYSFLQRNPD